MDVIEKTIPLKRGFEEIIIKFLVILLGMLIFLISIGFFKLGTISMVVLVGVIYGIYFFFVSRNIEYEFTMRSGDFFIDKIISKRRRKNLFNAVIKDFTIVAPYTDTYFTNEYKKYPVKKWAVSSRDADDIFFAALSYNQKPTIVFFQPDQQMKEMLRVYLQRKFFAV